jgi:hypothetical protein
MAAIITDQIRILNAKNFVAGISSSTNSYYSFIGLPNPTDIQSDWDTNPPSPKDNFDEENDYWDTMIALKKINASDVRQVVQNDFGLLAQLLICIVTTIAVQILQKFLVQLIYIRHHIM